MGKIGRNQHCPCGSRRKHKHCCGTHSTADSACPRSV
ncbi:SEC-C metal-binding domain-containing protein [Sphingopyxis sp.]